MRGFGFLCIFSYYSISSNNYKLLWKRLTQFHATGLFLQLFHDACPYYIETSPLICRTNQWTGFYMIRTSVMKELTPLKNIFGFVIFSEGSETVKPVAWKWLITAATNFFSDNKKDTEYGTSESVLEKRWRQLLFLSKTHVTTFLWTYRCQNICFLLCWHNI